MDLMEHAPNRAFWLKSVFDAEWRNIQKSMQSVDAKDLDFDIYQADEAMKIAGRVLARLQSNPTTRTLDYVVLATTAHMYVVMSARP